MGLKTVLGVLALILALPAVSKDIAPQNIEVIVSTVAYDYPPYQIIEHGRATGPDRDLLQEAFRRIDGASVRFELLPIGRIYEGLVRGEIDSTMGFRDKDYAYTSVYSKYPVHVSDYRLVTWKGRTSLKQLEDVDGLIIGVRERTVVNAELKKLLGDKVELLLTPNEETQMKMLKDGRVDAIFNNIDIVRHVAGKLELTDKLDFDTPKLIEPKPFYYAVARMTESFNPHWLIKQVDIAMESMREDGTWLEILKRYYGESVTMEGL